MDMGSAQRVFVAQSMVGVVWVLLGVELVVNLILEFAPLAMPLFLLLLPRPRQPPPPVPYQHQLRARDVEKILLFVLRDYVVVARATVITLGLLGVEPVVSQIMGNELI